MFRAVIVLRSLLVFLPSNVCSSCLHSMGIIGVPVLRCVLCPAISCLEWEWLLKCFCFCSRDISCSSTCSDCEPHQGDRWNIFDFSCVVAVLRFSFFGPALAKQLPIHSPLLAWRSVDSEVATLAGIIISRASNALDQRVQGAAPCIPELHSAAFVLRFDQRFESTQSSK